MDRAHPPAASRGASIAIVALLAAGFALTMAAFYPGYMTIDAEWVYKAIDGGSATGSRR